jgi:hypothetical protein
VYTAALKILEHRLLQSGVHGISEPLSEFSVNGLLALLIPRTLLTEQDGAVAL